MKITQIIQKNTVSSQISKEEFRFMGYIKKKLKGNTIFCQCFYF